MVLNPTNVPINCPRCTQGVDLPCFRKMHTADCGYASVDRHGTAAHARRNRWLASAGAVAAVLAAGATNPALAQVPATASVEPPAQSPAKPMSPARSAWMKGRCSQLVAFFDYYGVSRGENSDGPRNHTRIGAVIECERTHFRTGAKTMEALLKRKAFDLPAPGAPEAEPEDIEAPDITRPISQRY